jgi:hypothetical protein
MGEDFLDKIAEDYCEEGQPQIRFRKRSERTLFSRTPLCSSRRRGDKIKDAIDFVEAIFL